MSDIADGVGDVAPQPTGGMGYKQAYEKLGEIAGSLRDQGVDDIDQLIPLVDEALAAYAICKSRIDQVEKMLQEKLSGVSSQNSD